MNKDTGFLCFVNAECVHLFSMETKKKHSFDTRKRAFTIWQKLGYLPWHKKKEKKEKKGTRDFYKGAFDTIPFLNDDAKRTFVQLLLRPGYMIRDYIKGAHEQYLAPLTSLIVFYAFFALVSAVLQPVQKRAEKSPFHVNMGNIELADDSQREQFNLLVSTLGVLDKGWLYLHLDQFPDEVDTQHEASLAALEGTLRNQGIPLFLGQFFLLWLSMAWALRRYKLKMAATAAASAYVLCQFSFFMLFAVLATFGKETSISVTLMLILLVWDYHQWLDAGYKKSFRLAVSTGIRYGALLLVIIFLAAGTAFLIASTRQ